MRANREALGWKLYDVQYRLYKAHDLAFFNMGEVDSELWINYMSNPQP